MSRTSTALCLLLAIAISISAMYIGYQKDVISKMEMDLNDVGHLLTKTINQRDALQAMEIESVTQAIKERCEQKGIDFRICLAIAKTETGNFTSEAFYTCNNVGGMMSGGEVIHYPTLTKGVRAYVDNLAENYFNQGLDTIEKIQPKYCPDGDVWAINVRKFYEKYYTE